MKIKIILDGELRSCCSSLSADEVREIIESWVGDKARVEVIDRNLGSWQPDSLAALAENYFGPAIYPLVYVEDRIAMIGDLPDRSTLKDMLAGKVAYGVSQEDILEEARARGLLK